jgi:hypothetical protein
MFHLFLAFIVIVLLIGFGFGRAMAKVLLTVVGIFVVFWWLMLKLAADAEAPRP